MEALISSKICPRNRVVGDKLRGSSDQEEEYSGNSHLCFEVVGSHTLNFLEYRGNTRPAAKKGDEPQCP
jgi:hypothetical protein